MTCHIAQFIQDASGGGAERVAIDLANSFVERGFKSTMVFVNASGPNLSRLNPNVDVVDLSAGRLRNSCKQFRNAINKIKPDIVYAHMHPTIILASLCLRMTSHRPIIIGIAHSSRPSYFLGRESLPWKLANPVYRFMNSVALRGIAHLISVSKGVQDAYKAAYKHIWAKASVIENPIPILDIQSLATRPQRHHWCSSTGKTIVAIGRFNQAKGFDTLIRAVEIARRSIDVRLVILGDGALRPDFEQLIVDLDLSDAVDLPGFVENPYPTLAAADLFVLSSNWEGLPTVLIEALALETPIVSTDCESGPAEILEGGKWGTLVPVGDVVALAGAIVDNLKWEAPKPRYGLTRAMEFDESRAIPKHINLLRDLGVDLP